MVEIKTGKEIALMREGGMIAAAALRQLVGELRPGMSTSEIDLRAETLIRAKGGSPSFKGFEGYQFSTCLNIGEGVVHGVPKKSIVVKNGDVVKIDLGVFYKGFHTDTATTFCLGTTIDLKTRDFVEVGRLALERAIKKCRFGNRLGDVSAEIEKTIRSKGYFVVEELVGHGIGRRLHEDPQVPGLGRVGSGLRLREGMTLAIEVIYTHGRTALNLLKDGWTLVTADGKIAGLFEHTIAVRRAGVEILTL